MPARKKPNPSYWRPRPTMRFSNLTPRAGRQLLTAAAVVFMLVGAGVYFYSGSDAAFMARFRRAAADPGGMPADLKDDLAQREGGPWIAECLAADSDPRVRKALADAMLRDLVPVELPGSGGPT